MNETVIKSYCRYCKGTLDQLIETFSGHHIDCLLEILNYVPSILFDPEFWDDWLQDEIVYLIGERNALMNKNGDYHWFIHFFPSYFEIKWFKIWDVDRLNHFDYIR